MGILTDRYQLYFPEKQEGTGYEKQKKNHGKTDGDRSSISACMAVEMLQYPEGTCTENTAVSCYCKQ